jgi:hypothetical protein
MSEHFDLAYALAREIDPDFSPFDIHRYQRRIDSPPVRTVAKARKYQAAAVFEKVLYRWTETKNS